jgi:cyanate permease
MVMLAPFHIIGSFIRWSVSGFKGALNERINNDNAITNSIIGILVSLPVLFALIRVFTK